MTDSGKKNNHILVLPAFVSMVVALSVLIASTYAWYVTNRRTDDTASEVFSDSVDASIMPYSLFIDKQSAESDAQGNYTYTVTVYSDTDAAALNTYDAILGRNEHTPAYIRMPVYGVTHGDTLSFTITANGQLNEQGNVGQANGQNILMSQYISNIIAISCGNIPAATLSPSASKEDVYSGAKAWFNDNSATAVPQTFVPYTPAANPRDPVILGTKSNTVTFSFTSGDYTIEDDGMVYIYFKIDYEYPLVDAYITALRLELGGFKIGEAGHADFTGLIDPGFDLVSIMMTVRHPDQP